MAIIPKDFESIYKLEKERYKEMGFGFVIAILINLIFIANVAGFGHFIWPKILDFINERNWEINAALLMFVFMFNFVIYIIENCILWVIYHIQHPFFEKYKANNEPWPWNKDPAAWFVHIKRTLMFVGFNVLGVFPVLHYLNYSLNDRKVTHQIEIETLPDTMTIFVGLIFCMICEDFAFHWIHKLMHQPFFYQNIHKIHHEHNVTIGVASLSFHPIEVILAGAIPTALGPALLGPHMHLYTLLIWNFIRDTETIDGHCGYHFSWSPFRLIPFSGNASYHDFHHLYNVGNFSSFFTFWDTICGTNKRYFEIKDEITNYTKKAKSE